MAENNEAAGAAGRLEQALDRIEKATKARLRGDGPLGAPPTGPNDAAKVERVAQGLDVLIAELRAALGTSGSAIGSIGGTTKAADHEDNAV